MSSHCDDFIRKPFREENIFNLLQKYLGVEFIFEDINPISVNHDSKAKVLTTSALAELPDQFLVRLQQAINNLDLEQMQMIIDEIREIEPSLAQTIETYVKHFQYETLLDLITALSDE